MTVFTPPVTYPRIKLVTSFRDLVATPLTGGVNAVCWSRALAGDFAEVVRSLAIHSGINTLDDTLLDGLSVSENGGKAVDAMRKDLRRLRELDKDPALNCIDGYPRDESPGPVATDVFSFHADSAMVETETFLCTYHGPASEGLSNEEARRRVDIPEIRAQLLQEYGGKDDEAFLAHLSECSYDLHYAPVPDAQPFSFGQGNLWRIAVSWPGNPVPPCIHRAPETRDGDPPRLLLIA